MHVHMYKNMRAHQRKGADSVQSKKLKVLNAKCLVIFHFFFLPERKKQLRIIKQHPGVKNSEKKKSNSKKKRNTHTHTSIGCLRNI